MGTERRGGHRATRWAQRILQLRLPLQLLLWLWRCVIAVGVAVAVVMAVVVAVATGGRGARVNEFLQSSFISSHHLPILSLGSTFAAFIRDTRPAPNVSAIRTERARTRTHTHEQE